MQSQLYKLLYKRKLLLLAKYRMHTSSDQWLKSYIVL